MRALGRVLAPARTCSRFVIARAAGWLQNLETPASGSVCRYQKLNFENKATVLRQLRPNGLCRHPESTSVKVYPELHRIFGFRAISQQVPVT